MKGYNHRIKINFDDCIGCTRCMRVCHTEAIRIVNGKVKLIEEKCVNCGACFTTCHVHAFDLKKERLEELNQYPFNVAILPIAIYGMIKDLEDLNIVYQTLYDIGFDAVFDSSIVYECLGEKIESYVTSCKLSNMPYILTHCPSVVKLIQVKYSDLNHHLVPFDFPIEICAKLIRKRYAKQLKMNPDEVGISYISECLANYMEIKQPIGKKESNINFVFLLSTIFKDILKHIENDPPQTLNHTVSLNGILCAKVGGIRRITQLIDCLSVDGMNQVVEILEKLDMGQLNHINVLECYACVGGCVGGTFTLENPFIAKSKINRLVKSVIPSDSLEKQMLKELSDTYDWVFESELEHFDISKLDDDFFTSLVKLQQINDIYHQLPNIDCCACGSPSCRALAEDIVAGLKRLEDCIVLTQKKRGDNVDT